MLALQVRKKKTPKNNPTNFSTVCVYIRLNFSAVCRSVADFSVNASQFDWYLGANTTRVLQICIVMTQRDGTLRVHDHYNGGQSTGFLVGLIFLVLAACCTPCILIYLFACCCGLCCGKKGYERVMAFGKNVVKTGELMVDNNMTVR
jgi:hypothetical protein